MTNPKPSAPFLVFVGLVSLTGSLFAGAHGRLDTCVMIALLSLLVVEARFISDSLDHLIDEDLESGETSAAPCAWCEQEAGIKTSGSHGICKRHAAALISEAKADKQRNTLCHKP